MYYIVVYLLIIVVSIFIIDIINKKLYITDNE